jgi:hypothetical protein
MSLITHPQKKFKIAVKKMFINLFILYNGRVHSQSRIMYCISKFLIILVLDLDLHTALAVRYVQGRELTLLLLCFCRTYYKMYI